MTTQPLTCPPVGIPTHITREQAIRAAEVLGIDPTKVRSMRMDAHTVVVEYYIHGAEGERLWDSEGEKYATTPIAIPRTS